MSAPRRLRSKIHALPKPQNPSRRKLLQQAALATAAAAVLPACGNSVLPLASAVGSAPVPPSLVSPFKHGIASGDPLPNAVILWTRVTPVAAEDIEVIVRVFRDTLLSQLVSSRVATASAARDWTVKIDFDGLEPATTYYYQFEAKSFQSTVGRTKTAPLGDVSRLRFGLVSCSSYAHGFFNAYAFLAKRQDLEAIVHLGDYIYEYASDAASGDEVYGTARPYEPTFEMKTLADYRTRHGYYKRTDVDLQELHRQYAFITIWDDHESTDNAWRDAAANHNEGGKNEGIWTQRKSFAQQAYDEWMPIRLPEPGNPNRIWRKYRYGNLAEWILTDSRLFDRDVQLSTPIQPQEPRNAATRKLLGPVQKQFLLDSVKNSTSTWKLVGNQVVFMQWSYIAGLKAAGGPTGLNGDSWDAYTAERQSIIDNFRANSIKNVIICTGDVHCSWVGDITDDPNNASAYNPTNGTGSVCTEYVVTSVTSPAAEALAQVAAGIESFKGLNPHIKYIELTQKGYMLLDITPQRVQGEVYFVSTIASRGGSERFVTAFPTALDANRLSAAVTMPSTPVADAPALAP